MQDIRLKLVEQELLKLMISIENMNKDKFGAPFWYSGNYIKFLAILKMGFNIPYRTVQGIVRGLSD
jgi:hypothetical protein